MTITISRRLVVGLAVAALLLTSTVGAVAALSSPNGASVEDDAPSSSLATAMLAAEDVGVTETYTGVAPCRALDTRGGPMAPVEERDFDVTGDLSAQGGEAAGCGIPSTATSIAINLTAISRLDSQGFVRGWAAGSSPAEATLVNYFPGIALSNQVTIPLCTGTCTDAFTLKNFTGTVDIVGDVVGYYEAPMYAGFDPGGDIYSDISSGVVSVTKEGTGDYIVKFDRPVSNCIAVTNDPVWAQTRDVSADTTAGASDEARIRITDPSEVYEDAWVNVLIVC